LQRQRNQLNAYHVINNGQIAMYDILKEASRCPLLGYLMRRNRNGWSVCESINRMY
jgi:hypothetical protein